MPNQSVPKQLIVECAHCHTDFPHARRSGRRRLYCRRSCRQRAYEHRCRTAPPPRPHPFDHPTTNDGFAPTTACYAEGRTRFIFGKGHAVVAGPPDGKHRFPTLCGLQAVPGGRPFSNVRPDSCKSCVRLALRRPPTNSSRPHQTLLATQHHLMQTANAWRLARNTGHDADARTLSQLLQHALEPIARLTLSVPRSTWPGDGGR